MSIKIGADPEFFVKDLDTGKLVSAYGLVAGTKETPLPVDSGAVQVDGMALEININPAEDFEHFNGNLSRVLNQLQIMLPANLSFEFSPVAEFGRQYIDSQPEVARRLGCDPDWNAYTAAQNPPPNADMPFRTASGHIHIGWTENEDPNHPDHLEACCMLAKQLDVILGISSMYWDTNVKRRLLYGKAGAFRPKPYGMEYRVLSNEWLKNLWTRQFVFNGARYAFETLTEGIRWYEAYNAVHLINTNDIDKTLVDRDFYDRYRDVIKRIDGWFPLDDLINEKWLPQMKKRKKSYAIPMDNLDGGFVVQQAPPMPVGLAPEPAFINPMDGNNQFNWVERNLAAAPQPLVGPDPFAWIDDVQDDIDVHLDDRF